MQHTFFSLLTNKKERRARSIRASLNREFTAAGAPWFDGSQVKALKVKTVPSTK